MLCWASPLAFFLFFYMFWGSLCLYLKVKVERGCNQWGCGSCLVTGLLLSELFLMSWAWSICQNEAAALVLVANIWKLVKPNLSVWTDTAHLSGKTCFFSDLVGPTLQHFHRIRCAHWEVSNCEICHPPPHKGSNIFWELQISQKRKKKKHPQTFAPPFTPPTAFMQSCFRETWEWWWWCWWCGRL